MTRRIAVITGTRAEYGLLKGLIGCIEASSETELQLLVTGTHLVEQFGKTIVEIEADGFPIADRIDILMASDDAVGVAKSMSLALSGFAEAFRRLDPDLIVLLGDRTEILSAAAAALVAAIPIAHIHGGETTEGAYDEGIRHAVTKMAHLHFTSTERYRERIIQLGENPDHVFNVGAPGLDAIARLDPVGREELERDLGFSFGEESLLVTFHPETAEGGDPGAAMAELLAALDRRPDANLLFTLPNADAGGRELARMLRQFVAMRDNASLHASLGQRRYLSALRYVSGVVGNSSSGIIEVPSMGIGTLDIGTRQAGRIRADSVLSVPAERSSIARGIDELLSPPFRERCRTVRNPYGGGNAATAIFEVVRTHSLEGLTRKRFHDMPAGN